MKIIKIRYSTAPRDGIYEKGYGFLSFAKDMGTHATKVTKNLSNKYSQKIFDSAKKSTTDGIKTSSKRAIQAAAEATDDLIGNKIAEKITSVSKKFTKELQNDEGTNKRETDRASPKAIPKKDTYLQKKDNNLLMN